MSADVAALRLDIGGTLVDVVAREICVRDGLRPHRVTPKAMAVLCELAAAAGEVVERNDLLARVWPDTLPTDDVLTQAVTQLRKAFGAEGRHYIETIAKSGYRLVAPVAVVAQEGVAEAQPAGLAGREGNGASPGQGPVAAAPAAGSQSPLEQAPGQPRGRRGRPAWGRQRAWLRAVVVAALVLSPLVWVKVPGTGTAPRSESWGAHELADGPEPPYRLITSAPGFELSPTLSPGGSMMAYSVVTPGHPGASIQVQPTTAAQPSPLTVPPEGASDSLPAWSPVGHDIAFARRWPDGRCLVMIVSAIGAGPEREVLSCEGSALLGFSWAPDGTALLFGSMPGAEAGAGIRRYDLGTGEWKHIPYSTAGALDHAPQYSPDGRWIGFVRNPQRGDLWRVPAEGGKAEQLTRLGADMYGWSWLPDGQSIVFARGVGTGARLYELELRSGEVTDLGLDDGQMPAISMGSGALAFVQRHPRLGIHRIARDVGTGSALHAERIFESAGRDGLPSVSPDGKQLAFASDRTGHFELWVAELDKPESLRPLEGLRPDERRLPAWSPDSTRLLLTAERESGPLRLFEVIPATGQAMELPVPAARPLDASYLPDASLLLVTEEVAGGSSKLVLYDRTTVPWRALAAVDDVSQARVDGEGGRVVFTRVSRDGLWQVAPDLSRKSIRQLDRGMPSRLHFRSWAIARDGGIDYLQRDAGCMVWLRSLGAAADPGGQCLDRDRLAGKSGFSVEPGTGDLYIALAVDDGTDIALLQNFSSRPAPEGRISKLLKSLMGMGS